jgi:hypothetical protein
MPKVSEFFGISIYVYFEDHPPPHFHARYGEHEAQVAIDSLRILRGSLPPRVFGLVVEWGLQHRPELARAWDQASRSEPIADIEPLT